jgi:phytoene dehydrogenase-like protein
MFAAHRNTPGPVASVATCDDAQSKQDSTCWDLIVIGSGMAGIVCARDVCQAGFKVLLLDARDRLGGRTWTASFPGSSTDVDLVRANHFLIYIHISITSELFIILSPLHLHAMEYLLLHHFAVCFDRRPIFIPHHFQASIVRVIRRIEAHEYIHIASIKFARMKTGRRVDGPSETQKAGSRMCSPRSRHRLRRFAIRLVC